MITASLRIRLPEETWLAAVSSSYPSATFRLLTGIRTGETAVELGEVVADDPIAVSETIASHPSIVEYERLETTDERGLAKYETTDAALYDFIEASSLPPEFPIVARDGWYELDFTGTQEHLDQLRAGLEALDRSYELLSLVQTREANDLLTDRQREVLDAALRAGYFEVPRECSLAELAADLEIDKSTASGILRRGERRVLQQMLSDARF